MPTRFRVSSYWWPGAALALGMIALGCTLPRTLSAQQPPSGQPGKQLAADDVSWLFPPPLSPSDKAHLLAIKDIQAADPANPGQKAPVWTDAAFKNFLATADSSAGAVDGTAFRIGLPPTVRTVEAWFVAGIRIDAGAPGLSDAIVQQYGQRPQIRLILQPVLFDQPGHAKILDIAAHLIFDFVLPETPPPTCALHATPDIPALKAIVSDLRNLKSRLAAGEFGGTPIVTDGLPLGVHPALANPATSAATAGALKGFLESHLSSARLHSMALMGLPAGQAAPWIFLSMQLTRTGFMPVPGPTLNGPQFAMMFAPPPAPQAVMPVPNTNNLNPMTCASNAVPPGPPPTERRGLSTAELFAPNQPSAPRTREIIARIEDPAVSHFFNTDCVSCHTSTRRAMEVLHVASVPSVVSNALPNGPYDVRNFGWSIDGGISPSVSGRTGAETAAVVSWLNKNMPAD